MITRLFLCMIITSLVISCSTNKQENTGTQISTDIKSFDTAISFSGYWLNETYFNSIKKYGSPKKAQDGSEYIFIPERTLKPTMMIANFHEGGPSLTVLKTWKGYQLWETQDDSIVQSLFDINVLSADKIKIGDTTFVKINPVSIAEDQLVLQEILFKGQYTTSDGKHVEFKNNGKVSGLMSYQYYSPIIDYYDAGRQVDQVGFGTSENDLAYFGFKFKKDTLELYKLKCLTPDSSRCPEVDFGSLTYKLWRNK